MSAHSTRSAVSGRSPSSRSGASWRQYAATPANERPPGVDLGDHQLSPSPVSRSATRSATLSTASSVPAGTWTAPECSARATWLRFAPMRCSSTRSAARQPVHGRHPHRPPQRPAAHVGGRRHPRRRGPLRDLRGLGRRHAHPDGARSPELGIQSRSGHGVPGAPGACPRRVELLRSINISRSSTSVHAVEAT